MGDLKARLQVALGDAYRIERELGGGGMSRVFLAEERALGRKVVIKVLPPDMALGVNAERFRREIQLAASLQHPHIVPLLSAGASGELLYYTMPFVEGESLRAKLVREGELPVSETIRILADVADALAYAHAHGVVHRDIKPDNVLLSGKHAVVTDFGVSKAVSASSGGSLTSLGVALGTPAYMAPEQAAADPHVDHRADLYALGVLGYEMLTGRPPFALATSQATLAAQVTQTPQPVTAQRPAVPTALNALVMRCLEKHPADRWQNGTELAHQLEAMATPSGGMAPTGEALPLSSGAQAALRRTHPLRVAGWFALAGLGVLAAVDVLVRGLGLPDWVLYTALGLLGVGLPIMLVTGLVERRRILASTGRVAPSPETGVMAWLSWRKAIVGGVVAFAGLGAVTAAYMGMRLLGIGPIGTLVASGVIKDREPVLLANFDNRAPDSTLGPSLTEAFRVDLSESPTVKLIDAQAIREALARMQRHTGAPLDLGLAREVAERDGVKAVVTGQIDPVGGGYVLSASLVSAADGRVLTAVRETAENNGGLIRAIDRLSRKLRERIGESLRTIRASEPLEQVTTGSLEALRTYSEAVRAEGERGDYERAIPLLEEATSLDTGFAMAYRKLAVVLFNSAGSQARIVAAATRAFEHRDRLPELERYLATAFYYDVVEYNPAKRIATYRSALERYPDNTIALNNLALALNSRREWREAESLAVRATVLDHSWPFFANAILAQTAQRHFADAKATLERLAQFAPRSPYVSFMGASLSSGQGDYAAAEQELRRLREQQRTSPYWQAQTSLFLSALDGLRGKLASSEQHLRAYMAESELRDLPQSYFLGALGAASLDLRYRNRPAEALRKMETALERHPLAAIPAFDRPYVQLAEFYARAGRPDRAKRLLAEYEANVPEGLRRGQPRRYAAAGAVALAEGHAQDAIAAFRTLHDESPCVTCGLLELATAYEQARQPDSALTTYEQLITIAEPVAGPPAVIRLLDASYSRPAAYKRLGELYEARGDRRKALEYYSRFVELWKDADPELQPMVRDVRARIARLAGEH